jgi:hypothetical protein
MDESAPIWSSQLLQHVYRHLDIVKLDVFAVVHPSCLGGVSFPQYLTPHPWAMLLLVPATVAALVLYSLAACGCRRARRCPADGCRRVLHQSLLVVYPLVTAAAARLLHCRMREGGGDEGAPQFVVVSHPEQRCFRGEHLVPAAVAAAAFALCVVGLVVYAVWSEREERRMPLRCSCKRREDVKRISGTRAASGADSAAVVVRNPMVAAAWAGKASEHKMASENVLRGTGKSVNGVRRHVDGKARQSYAQYEKAQSEHVVYALNPMFGAVTPPSSVVAAQVPAGCARCGNRGSDCCCALDAASRRNAKDMWISPLHTV